MRIRNFVLAAFAALGARAQSTLVTLTDSGDTLPIAIPAGAQEPAEAGLTQPLALVTPAKQCNRFTGVINAGVAIPYGGAVRKLTGLWNGAPLQMIDPPYGTEWVEEAHAYGSMRPFFKPLFSLAGVPAGPGVLTIRGDNAAGQPVAAVSLSGAVVAPPAPVTITQLAARARPRLWLTPARMARATAHLQANDAAGQRFNAAIDHFFYGLDNQPDIYAPNFQAYVYDPEGYLPDLLLCHKVHGAAGSPVYNAARANRCASAALTMTRRIASEYLDSTRSYGRDSGYDIRFELMRLMLARDWLDGLLTAGEKTQLATVATQWLDWYAGNGYARSHPVENYYAGYLQGRILGVIATAGDNPDGARLLAELHRMLAQEVPIISQRACGGDWSEGWNYGPYTYIEFLLANATLRENGEDWGAAFSFLDNAAISYSHLVSPGMTQTRPVGGYSGDYPHLTHPALLAALSGESAAGAWGSRLYDGFNAQPGNDYLVNRSFAIYELLTAVSGSAPDLAGAPLSYRNAGTGRFSSRSAWNDANGYQVMAENSPYLYDHMGYAPGDVRLYKGDTCLLCPSTYRGPVFGGEDETPAFSTYLVNGQNAAVNRNNQLLFYRDESRFSALGMRFESAFPTSRYDENLVDPANPLDYLIREVVHIRPGTLVVRDLHRRRAAAHALQARWHLGSSAAATLLAPGRYDIGGMKLSFAGGGAVTPVFAPEFDHGVTRIGTLATQDFPATTAPLEQIAVFSETDHAVGYSGGVLQLSTGNCVTFANGTVDVQPCGCAPSSMGTLRIAKGGGGALAMSWPAAAGMTGYSAYRQARPDPDSWGPPVVTAPGAAVGVSDPAPPAGSVFYSVTVRNGCGAESAK